MSPNKLLHGITKNNKINLNQNNNNKHKAFHKLNNYLITSIKEEVKVFKSMRKKIYFTFNSL
mgnify:CR=1 FL=1